MNMFMGYRAKSNWLKSFRKCLFSLLLWQLNHYFPLMPNLLPNPDRQLECELLVVGGGLAGAAASYEALLAGKTVCLTEITDWVGGQISSQGTSALDERTTQRDKLFYPRGYLELRDRIEEFYGELNPGECWVSVSCFLPKDAHTILLEQLRNAELRRTG